MASSAEKFRLLVSGLGADSLDMAEIHMDVEVAFGISIPQVDYEKVHTVGDLINCVEKTLAR